MVLQIALEHLAETMAQLGVSGPVFVSGRGAQSLVTAADPGKGILLQCHTPRTREDAKAWLAEKDITALDGSWSQDGMDAPGASTSFWITAVAYKSHESKPGLWVDAMAFKPTVGEVLTKIYDEFRDAGDMEGLSLEEFIQRAEPNVVILDPEEQARFAADSDC